MAILDEAFAAIATATANAEKNLANARELFESTSRTIFQIDACTSNPAGRGTESWPVVSVAEITELVTKGTTPTSVGHAFTDAGVNFLKVETLSKNGEIKPDKVAHISSECHADLQRSQLKEDDILFSIAGALGRTGIVQADVLPANTNQALAIIRLRKDASVLPRYIFRALSSGVLIEQIERNRGGVAQQNLSLAQVKAFQLPMPSLADQETVVAQLDQLALSTGALEQNQQQKLAHLENLKQSLLHKAFTGELTADSKAADRSLSEAGV